MKFKHGTRRRALEYEKDWVQRWKENKAFEKSIANRPASNSYVFYDGPPFITGVPHHGTLLSSIVKDVVPRYWTMKGKHVERVWGWDCHGLPAEVFTEKKLGIKDRRDIGTKISLEEYITTARDNMVQTSSLWNDTIDRIGRWVDMDNAYKTMDKEYMESIWWAFKTLHEKGKIYEGERVLMYCTRDATPLSKAEVTMDAGAYQDVTDPSVYVKFKLEDKLPNSNNLPEIDRVIVGGGVISSDGKILLGHNRRGGVFQGQVLVPGGGVDDGETKLEALQREMKEELGIDISKAKIEKSDLVMTGSSEKTLQETGERVYVNMEFHNYTMRFDVPAAEIAVSEDDDFEQAAWYSKEELLGLTFSPTTARYLRKIGYLPNDFVNKADDTKYLLAWTTTPWTLPANTAVAVNKDLDYAEVRVGNEQFILAKELAANVLTDEKRQPLEYKVLREFKGEELIGRSYEPLLGVNRGEGAHKVWAADYVTTESGTGIVHLAPAYGEEDFILAQEKGIPVVHVIDENGLYLEGDWTGENVWEANKPIAKKLHEDGIVWKIDYYRHSYPHCHRCGTRLMYRAHPSWFFDVQGQKPLMLEKNGEQIEWFPEHLKHGRFEKNIEQAPDWNLSRDRFWATAMPVWEGTDANGKKHQIVVGSYDELYELSGQRLEDYHRPWVDAIEFDKDGVHYTRIDKVLDGWFESGSMPFAQFHYPFENKEKFEASFPGDFIAEYIGQVRAWFYYVHTVSVGLFGESAFRNVITTGVMAGNDGRKMSKSYGNYTDPNELMDKFSADSLRFLLAGSPLLKGEDFALQDKDVGDVARKLSMVWNMYDFFTMYAEVDGWEFDPENAKDVNPADVTNPLDKWIISRVHQLNEQVTKDMDGYNIPDAMSGILPFIEDASNWYVRRSRRRFWKSEDDGDKNDAYQTLHYVLRKLAVLLAPFTPFMAEELYQNLGGGAESVHLLDWPTNYTVDQLVLDEMEQVRTYVNEGLSLRAKAGLKVRQPLASVTVPSLGKFVDYQSILTDELNVKEVNVGTEVMLDEALTPELKREGMMREVIRHVQAARKAAGLNVDDHIVLQLATDAAELATALTEHSQVIASETLADTLAQVSDGYSADASVDGQALKITLKKA